MHNFCKFIPRVPTRSWAQLTLLLPLNTHWLQQPPKIILNYKHLLMNAKQAAWQKPIWQQWRKKVCQQDATSSIHSMAINWKFGWQIMCCGVMAMVRLWPCLLTMNVILNLPANTNCPLNKSLALTIKHLMQVHGKNGMPIKKMAFWSTVMNLTI